MNEWNHFLFFNGEIRQKPMLDWPIMTLKSKVFLYDGLYVGMNIKNPKKRKAENFWNYFVDPGSTGKYLNFKL